MASVSHLGFWLPSRICRRRKNPVPTMKKKLTSKSAFFNLRVLIAAVFWLTGTAAVVLAVITMGPDVGKFDYVASVATPTPTPCAWLNGQDLPSVGTRLVGVFYSGDFNHSRSPSPMDFPGVPGATPTPVPVPPGKFYAMGGRS